MERIWLKQYPAGVPADIDPSQYPSLVALLEESFAKFRDRKAFICMDKSISYRELDELSLALGAYLQSRGLAKGARVAIMMPNVLQHPVATSAVLRAGFAVVNVNPLYTPRELEHQLKDSGAEAIIVLENFASVVQQVIGKTAVKHVIVGSMGDLLGLKGMIVNLVVRRVKKMVPAWSLPGSVTFNEALSAGRSMTMNKPAIGPDDVAFLQYTGGTTGIAKAAMLTHRNIMANVEQSRVWFGVSAEDGRARVMVTALPLYHIFALTCCFFFYMKVGGCCLLIANPRDADGFIKTLKGTRFTHFSGVNTLFNLLINHQKIGEVDFSNLDFVIAGGMAVQAAVAEKWKAITGRAIVEGYGLSETSPVVCVNPPDIAEWSGTIGYPLPSTDVSIRALDGCVVGEGEAGELCVSGPQVMAGYWKRPDETALATTPDGYFRTGDVAVLQADGQIRIVDRMKDMILVSGFNVYPNEIEDVLASHPGVLECAVVGAVHEETGEMVVAHVVRKDDAMTTDALRSYAREQLTGYKVPRRVVFHDALPKTNVGKVLRRALRDDPPAP